MKRLFRWLGVFVVLLTLALGWLVATQSGSRFVLDRVDAAVSALSLDSVSGTLWSGVSLSHLSFRQDGFDLVATDLGGQWRLGCLLNRRVCIDSLAGDTLSIKLAPSSTDSDPAPSPELADIELPLGVQLNALRFNAVRVSTGGSVVELEDLQLALAAESSRLELSDLGLRWQVGAFGGRLEGDAVLETVGDYPVSLDALVLAERGEVAGGDWPLSELSISLSETLTDLRADVRLLGLADATLGADVRPFDAPVSLDAALAVASARWPLTGESEFDIAGTDIVASGDLDRLDVTVSGTLRTPLVDPVVLDWDAAIDPALGVERSQFRVAALDGTLSGDLSVGWRDGLTVDVDVLADDINPEPLVPDLTGRVGGRVSARVLSGQGEAGGLAVDRVSLDVSGRLRDQPVALKGDGSFRDGTARIEAPGLDVVFGDNRAVVAGTAGDTLALSSTLNLTDLSQILPALRGVAQGDLALNGARGRPSVTANVRADGVRIGDASVQRLRLDGDLIAGGTEDSDVSLEWTGLEIGEQTVESGVLDVTGDRTAHVATVAIDSTLAQARWRVEGRLDDTLWQGRLVDSWLEFAEHRWKTASPIDLTYTDNSLQVDAHCWQSTPARVCLTAPARLAASGAASVELTDLPVEWASAALPDSVALTGVVDGVVDAVWVAGALPALRSRIDVRTLVAEVPSSSGDRTAIALGDLVVELAPPAGPQGQDAIRATVGSAGGALGEAQIDLLLPFDKPLEYRGEVQWQNLQLAALQPLLPDLDALAGELSVDSRVRGENSGPVFDGTVRLRGGELRGLDLPTELFAVWLDLGLNGTQADLTGGWRAASDAPSDAVALKGNLNWTNEPALDLQISGSGLPVDYPPWVRASVDPDLSIKATARRVLVRGSVEIPEADIEIVAPESRPPTPSADTVLLDDTTDSAGDGNAGAVTDVDVAIVIRDEVYLAGFGFDSRLQGAFDVRLAPRQPLQLFGDLSILDGRYQAWGQNLAVERGELVFSGPPETAIVDAIAWRELETVKAGVAVSGQIAAPEVRVISEPSLPDQEALSYLVLGRAWGEAGDQQAAITRAALSLGLKRSGGLTNRVADGLGLQSLSVEAQGSGEDTSAVVNAQLNDKLSLQYGVGVFVPFRTLTARYQLGKQLYVEAVQGVESALDFFYSFEF